MSAWPKDVAVDTPRELPVMMGARVRFAPNPRFPERKIEAEVVRHRGSPNATGERETLGWLDTRSEDGAVRSVRASRCEVLS